MSTLLTICPYRMLPLRGGGALRCFHLLRQLARFHEVHAIVFQGEAELRRETDGYKVPDSVRVYSPIDNPPPQKWRGFVPSRISNAFQYRWLRRSPEGPATAELLRSHHLIRGILSENQIDAVVFEHLSSMSAAPLVRRLSPRTVRILDAHNVDHRLYEEEMKQRVNGGPSATDTAECRRLRRIEQNLSREVDAVWTCSEEDRAEFAAHNRLPVYSVPNGVDVRRCSFDTNPDKRGRRSLLFCGSLGYPPNAEGLKWFLSQVWPLLRDKVQELRIVGRGSNGSLDQARLDGRVQVIGEVPELQPYYQHASVAICPLQMGSGTRLKILEAMSFGVPLVSTRIGAEGIRAQDGEHLLLADAPADFANAVQRLLSDASLYERIRQSARRLVEQRYDWDVIGKAAMVSLSSLSKPASRIDRPSMAYA